LGEFFQGMIFWVVYRVVPKGGFVVFVFFFAKSKKDRPPKNW